MYIFLYCCRLCFNCSQVSSVFRIRSGWERSASYQCQTRPCRLAASTSGDHHFLSSTRWTNYVGRATRRLWKIAMVRWHSPAIQLRQTSVKVANTTSSASGNFQWRSWSLFESQNRRCFLLLWSMVVTACFVELVLVCQHLICGYRLQQSLVMYKCYANVNHFYEHYNI